MCYNMFLFVSFLTSCWMGPFLSQTRERHTHAISQYYGVECILILMKVTSDVHYVLRNSILISCNKWFCFGIIGCVNKCPRRAKEKCWPGSFFFSLTTHFRVRKLVLELNKVYHYKKYWKLWFQNQSVTPASKKKGEKKNRQK